MGRAMFTKISTLGFPIALAPAVADINGDGAIELYGTLNDGSGNLIVQSLPDALDGRVPRDYRLADLDGDGTMDVVANTYTVGDVENSHILILYDILDNGGTVSLPAGQLYDGFGETILVADFNN